MGSTRRIVIGHLLFGQRPRRVYRPPSPDGARGRVGRKAAFYGTMLGVCPRAGLAATILAAAGLALAQAAPAPQKAAQPLPDVRRFLGHGRENLRSDGALLADYTFTEKHSEARLDSHGAIKKMKTAVYEVYPSEAPGKMYRKLIVRDGKPVDPKELAAQDKEEGDKQKEREIVEELFKMDELVMEGRETIDGRGTIVVSFRPRPGYKPASEGARAVQKLKGRAWVDEDNYQIVKIQAELLDSLGVGPGRLIRLQKGAQAYFERRRVNDEIWLPARARFTGAAKALFFVIGRVDVQSDYGDYRKFNVSTSETVSAEKSSD